MGGDGEAKKKVSLPVSFLLGGISGCIGATSVYPMDMIKTRLQSQRTGERLYNGIIDCGVKIVRKEGVMGLYKGLPAQWVGILPEKSVKLGSNDLFRRFFMRRNAANGAEERLGKRQLFYWQESAAGAGAGFLHVLFTSPYETVKIQLQVQGTMPDGYEKKSGTQIVRQLGLRGLFQGASACFLRDVTFSVFYFALYNYLKDEARARQADPDAPLGFATQLAAGTAAGAVASGAVTPADVVKTRLQEVPRPGMYRYKGMTDCFRYVIANEGAASLFKGIGPRMAIIAPLFGITFFCYENFMAFLQK